jgi:uncharacterized protein YjiS (DUF1127 family)
MFTIDRSLLPTSQVTSAEPSRSRRRTGRNRKMIDLVERALHRFCQRRGGRLSMPGADPSHVTAIWARPVSRMPRTVIHGRTAEEFCSASRSVRDRHLPLSASGMTTRLAAKVRLLVSRSGTMIRRLLETVLTWRVRSLGRRVLLELDDRMLRDMGFSQADVHREAAKPFWRA